MIITLDVEDQGNAEFWKDFNPESWATAETAGMKNVTRCAAPSRCVMLIATMSHRPSQLCNKKLLPFVGANVKPILP